ncbi:DUF1318 domain-containing protein [Thermodesulfatator atlanticus]|uniref:DUF1318 domain-containing protein n=1 Tax=Thermodesulfatator atlanticus TaxID=501497 RepID=UPI0003B450C6|nr:DUF1318 domain-containing protein [Thermodesulfatator atlanticus]
MKKKMIFSLLALVIVSCVTINIYFPSAEVEKAAKEISEEVRGLKQKQETKPEDNQSFLKLGPKVAYAQQELAVTNPAIRQLKARMKARYPKLKPYLVRGVFGEALNGFIVLRNPNGLKLKERAAVKRLLEAENKDRKILYQEVMKALGVMPKDLPRIQQIFAKEWQRTAPKGTWIEKSPGKWVRK